jgi:hypothetical protein
MANVAVRDTTVTLISAVDMNSTALLVTCRGIVVPAGAHVPSGDMHISNFDDNQRAWTAGPDIPKRHFSDMESKKFAPDTRMRLL